MPTRPLTRDRGQLPIEQIDPRDASSPGTFPQASSHLGVIASGWELAQARRAEAGRS